MQRKFDFFRLCLVFVLAFVASSLTANAGVAELAPPTPIPNAISQADYVAQLKAGLALKDLPSKIVPNLENAPAPNFLYHNGCHAHMSQTKFPSNCTFGDTLGSGSIWLIGDSHAAQWFYAMDAIAKQSNSRLIVHTKSSCEISNKPAFNTKLNRTYTECGLQNAWWVSELKKAKPNLVVVGSYFGLAAQQEPAMAAQIKLIRSIVKNVIMLGDTAQQNSLPAQCLAAHSSNVQACTVSVGNARPAVASYFKTQARENHFSYVDTSSYLCYQGLCPEIADGYLLYRDYTHITGQAALYLKDRLYSDIGPVLNKALAN